MSLSRCRCRGYVGLLGSPGANHSMVSMECRFFRLGFLSGAEARMIAAWYDRQGPAVEVLQIGELPAPKPAPGEVRVRVALSGVNPGDTKKRAGWPGSPMIYPRVIPHSDGAGVIDAVGEGVDANGLGERGWTYGAPSYRPF